MAIPWPQYSFPNRLQPNATHSLPRSRADLQHAIRRALLTKRWQKRSDRWIGRFLHCDDKTVSAMRTQLETTAEIPQLKKRTGEDGKARLRTTRRDHGEGRRGGVR